MRSRSEAVNARFDERLKERRRAARGDVADGVASIYGTNANLRSSAEVKPLSIWDS